MKLLITSDIHLTDRPEDEYRWDVFDHLQRFAELHKPDAICLLGDITDAKDKHSARLVNRVVSKLLDLVQLVDVHIVCGNHDYIDPECPFLAFVDEFMGITFYGRSSGVATRVPIADGAVLLVPNGCLDKALNSGVTKQGQFDVVLMHETVDGALTSTGYEMQERWSGRKLCERLKTFVISGDIHVPQQHGDFYYCGSPHPVHFGDEFSPQMLLFDTAADDPVRRLPVTTIRKHTLRVSSLDTLDAALQKVEGGDQVKILVSLKRAEFHLFDELSTHAQQQCSAKRAVLRSVALQAVDDTTGMPADPSPAGARLHTLRTPQQQLAQYARAVLAEQSDDVLYLGKELLSAD